LHSVNISGRQSNAAIINDTNGFDEPHPILIAFICFFLEYIVFIRPLFTLKEPYALNLNILPIARHLRSAAPPCVLLPQFVT
jgi:hypothetical protein